MRMSGQMRHHPQLLLLIDQGHHALVNAQCLQVAHLDLILHIHQRIADSVNVVLCHRVPIVESSKRVDYTSLPFRQQPFASIITSERIRIAPGKNSSN